MADIVVHGHGVLCDAEAEGLFTSRGWSMRSGRRKRLVTPFRAAGSDPLAESSFSLRRGRAVFKRSVNRGARHEWCFCDRRNDSKIGKVVDALDAPTLASSASEWLADWHWGAIADEWWVEECAQEESEEDVDVDSESRLLEKRPTEDCEECSTCASADDASLEEPFFTPRSGIEDLASGAQLGCSASDLRKSRHVGGDAAEQRLSRWEMAVRRAEVVAKTYVRQPLAAADVPKAKQKKEKETFEPFEGEKRHLSRLQLLHSTYSVECLYKRPKEGRFEELRWAFFQSYAETLCSAVKDCLGYPVQLSPTPLNAGVGKSFAAACAGDLPGKLVPALHGTDQQNLGSIYECGLVIPGSENGVRIANGSAYGVGVYTARLESAFMSRGYARGQDPPVLVCGVLDPGCDEAEVRHAGGAMVVFNQRRVAPLFVASRMPQKACVSIERRHRRIADLQPPTTLRRGPMKQEKLRRARLSGKAQVLQLVGVAKFLNRRAARRRFSRGAPSSQKPAKR